MSKIIHYRDKCIGCGVCQQEQPGYWRISRRDGKATLLNAQKKKRGIHVLAIDSRFEPQTKSVAASCPVRIIKVLS